MRPPLEIAKLLTSISDIGRESSSPSELLLRCSERIRASYPETEVIPKDLSSSGTPLDQLDEFTINTGKPYVDNNLSGYSAFKELIGYYNRGFRSCLVLPIKDEGRPFGTLTLLSKEEESFGKESVDLLTFAAEQLSKTASLKFEKEKSATVAKYFDASFNSSIPQLLIDRNGSVVKANKAIINMLDKTVKDITQKNLRDMFEIDADSIARLLAGSRIEARGKGQSTLYLRLTSSQINERLFDVVVYDITDIRRMQEMISLLDNSDDEVFLMLDKDSRIIWMSENSNKAMNIENDSIMGNRFTDLVYDNEQFIASMKAQKLPQQTFNIKLNMGNGVIMPVKLKAFSNGGGLSVILSKDYITYIDMLRKSIDELVSLSSDAILLLDESGYIKGQNKSAERMLNYTASIAGVPISTIIANTKDQNAIDNAIAIAKKSQMAANLLLNMSENNTKQPIPFEAYIESIRDDNNRITGFMVIGKELRTRQIIADLRQGVEAMTRQAERLKTESDLKTQFIYNISHELKTPITNISGFSRLLLKGEFGELTPEQKEYIQIIITELDRLMGLIQQILDVVKLASGRMKLDLQQVDFNDLLQNPSIKSFNEACEQKGLYFTCKVEPNMPLVTADPNRLIQVFVNLIGNALKFTEHGGISISVSRKGKNVKVDVTDTGIGISKDAQSKLFKEFYQLPRKGLTIPQGSGTGLGLAITKEIIKKHGGRIKVVSEVGKGSTFWFTLPITVKQKKPAAEAKAQDQPGTGM
ncbi:MAG: PAS domain-containing protein [Candidatus Micrarchaeota archaeon]|nr:PAS domain-containing protein [Candidatus Micrarchaeota archaeon]